MNGRRINPELRSLFAIAGVLECSVAWLLTPADNVPQETPALVAYSAHAGSFRTMQKNLPVSNAAEPFALDRRFAGARHLAIKIEDDNLEGLQPAVTRGHIALFVDLSEADFDVETGRVYLIHRKNSLGLVETAFWRATVFRAEVEFAPATKDAARNEREKFTIPRQALFSSDDIKISGLFYRAYSDY